MVCISREEKTVLIVKGFDTVGLGYTTNDGPTLTHQIVSEIYSQTWWFGILGLGFQTTNFTTYANPVPSFADTLYSNGTISSRSWSYTAGAYYALKTGMLGNLIFGGYDASRFTPNDVTFTMTEDNLRDIVVSVQSITSTTAHGNTTLMSSPELVFIDSTVPELWLPVEVCQQFEKAFGIALDPNSSTYLVNETTHNNLLSLNPNITLTLANQQTGGPTVDIVLPYAAFDMNVTAPILPNRTSYYFPLMQAGNSSQYTLGRTFLQEAYVTADYNSRTFNVSQCIFDPSASAQVIAIPSVLPTASPTPGGGGGNTTSTTGSSGKKLSGGDIAGIVIGVLLFFAVVGSVVACCLTGVLCFPSRKKDKDSTRPSTPPVAEIGGTRIPKGTGPFPTAYSEQASAFTSEVDGQDAKVEIQGNPIMHPQELEAEVPMPPGNIAAGKTNGPSDSSNDTGVSSLSPIRENGPGRTPMAELGAQERGLGYGSVGLEDRGNDRDRDTIVSPASEGPGRDSMMGRARGAGAGSPTLSSPSEGTGTVGAAGWTPSTPVQRAASGSRFEEHWEDGRNG
jgi:hypothetical protein